jgi:hypothetical protein
MIDPDYPRMVGDCSLSACPDVYIAWREDDFHARRKHPYIFCRRCNEARRWDKLGPEKEVRRAFLEKHRHRDCPRRIDEVFPPGQPPERDFANCPKLREFVAELEQRELDLISIGNIPALFWTAAIVQDYIRRLIEFGQEFPDLDLHRIHFIGQSRGRVGRRLETSCGSDLSLLLS